MVELGVRMSGWTRRRMMLDDAAHWEMEHNLRSYDRR